MHATLKHYAVSAQEILACKVVERTYAEVCKHDLLLPADFEGELCGRGVAACGATVRVRNSDGSYTPLTATNFVKFTVPEQQPSEQTIDWVERAAKELGEKCAATILKAVEPGRRFAAHCLPLLSWSPDVMGDQIALIFGSCP